MQAKAKKSVLFLIIAAVGAFAGCYLAILINQYVLPSLSPVPKAVFAVLVQWIPAVVPVIVMILAKDKPTDLGFRREKLPLQIAIGILLGILMSVVLTVIPILCGLKNFVGGENAATEPILFIYQFIYCILGVAFAEEFVFRGILFREALNIRNSKVFAIVLSSVLFGLFHIFNGNIIQILITAVLGALWCIAREKIPHCTLLSLILAHGIYDALIFVWRAIL